jgi:uncharacterized membrane protein
MESTQKQPVPDVQVEKEKASKLGNERLIALCDGIFAIAITLLVFDLKLPTNAPANQYPQDMANLLNECLLCIVTFVVIAVYWISHRRLMHLVKRSDEIFTRLTFLYLAFIVFFPVSMNILNESGSHPQGVIFYTLILSGCGFSFFILWGYALWQHRLIDPDTDHLTLLQRAFDLLINPVYFCLSLLLLLLPHFKMYPQDIFYSWIALPLVGIVSRQLARLIANRNHGETE